ncbi:MAG: tetratricopeptide repeat protein [Anaerolineae bacterium]|nr:tetratricopeptide repeat protein [Anaerolineae bacterium]MDQ7033786.1 tetratricopeptide repeat protein [Anaerolineae bacterium]
MVLNIKAAMAQTTIRNYLQAGDFHRALNACRVILEDARERQDEQSEAIAIIGLAQVHQYIGKFYDARVYADGGLQSAQAIAIPELTTMALNTRASIFFVGNLKFDEAEADYRAALQLAHNNDDKRGIATALAGIAAIYNHAHDYNRAIKYARESFDFAREMPDDFLMATALGIMGNGFVKQGSYEKSLKAFDDALGFCEKYNNKLIEIYLMGNKGFLLTQDVRYFDDGLQLLDQALTAAQDMDCAPHEFALLHMNAITRERVGQDDIALDYYLTMVNRAQTWENRAYEALTFYEIGRMYTRSKEYNESIDNFGHALLISRETMNPFYEAQVESAMGMTYALMHDYESALSHYMAARTLYDALGDDSRTSSLTQTILLTYINRLIDRILRFLGVRQSSVEETSGNDD